MIGGLPDGCLYSVLIYTDPSFAYSLSLTSKSLNSFVNEFYKRHAGKLIREGGEWHHCVKSKRTRDSIGTIGQMTSYAPMGIWSIMNQRCIGCNKSYKAAVHKCFGVIAHTQCIRHRLINAYYLEKFGLFKRHFEDIPHCELSGYAAGHYGRGVYSYTALWKDRANGVVPYEWTAYYLVHERYAEEVKENERQRIAKETAQLEKKKQKKKYIKKKQ